MSGCPAVTTSRNIVSEPLSAVVLPSASAPRPFPPVCASFVTVASYCTYASTSSPPTAAVDVRSARCNVNETGRDVVAHDLSSLAGEPRWRAREAGLQPRCRLRCRAPAAFAGRGAVGGGVHLSERPL